MIGEIVDNIKYEINSIVKNIKEPMTYMDTYKYQNLIPYESRCQESQKIIKKHYNYVPVIVNINNESLKLKKNKFLVNMDQHMSMVIYSIRKQLVLEKYQAIFAFCDNTLLNNTQTIGEIYEKYKFRNNIKPDGDQFLYITICLENTFGK